MESKSRKITRIMAEVIVPTNYQYDWQRRKQWDDAREQIDKLILSQLKKHMALQRIGPAERKGELILRAYVDVATNPPEIVETEVTDGD